MSLLHAVAPTLMAALFLAACGVPEGMFACGDQSCSLATEYCEHWGSDVSGEPDAFECEPLPAACGRAASCACLAAETCGELCRELEEGGLQATCPGG